MCLFCVCFIRIQEEVILPVYVLKTYFYVYRYAYVLLRDLLLSLCCNLPQFYDVRLL